MKLSITIICVIVVLYDKIKFTSSQDDDRFEIDLFDGMRRAGKGLGKASQQLAKSFVNASRMTSNGCKRGFNYMLNISFATDYQDAEYFFYSDEKLRDRHANELIRGLRQEMMYDGERFKNGDQAIKYSYYCQVQDLKKLKDYCFYATYKNRIVSKRVKMNPREDPECVFRNVYIIQYKYETWRTLLRCPTISVKKGEAGKKADIFIMPVENSYPSRLMFYLFMRSKETKRKRIESLMSQSQSESIEYSNIPSIEYEPRRVSTDQSYDLRDDDRESISDFQPARHSLGDTHEIHRMSRQDEASSSATHETEEIESIGGIRSAELAERRNVQRGPLQHTISIRDHRPGITTDNRPVRFKLPRSAQSSIAAYQFGRTKTAKIKDYKRRHVSLPTHRLSESDGEEELAKPKPVPLEIVNLIINRRHTIGRQRPLDPNEVVVVTTNN